MRDEPVHGMPLLPDQWWGCQQPERPFNLDEVWDERCPKCLLKMKLDLAKCGDVPMFDAEAAMWPESKGMLSDVIRAIEAGAYA